MMMLISIPCRLIGVSDNIQLNANNHHGHSLVSPSATRAEELIRFNQVISNFCTKFYLIPKVNDYNDYKSGEATGFGQAP